MIFFLIFALKHRSWVLTEVALTCAHGLCFEQKQEKISFLKIQVLTAVKNCSILYRRVSMMKIHKVAKAYTLRERLRTHKVFHKIPVFLP